MRGGAWLCNGRFLRACLRHLVWRGMFRGGLGSLLVWDLSFSLEVLHPLETNENLVNFWLEEVGRRTWAGQLNFVFSFFEKYPNKI